MSERKNVYLRRGEWEKLYACLKGMRFSGRGSVARFLRKVSKISIVLIEGKVIVKIEKTQ